MESRRTGRCEFRKILDGAEFNQRGFVCRVGVRLGEHDLSNAGPDCEDDLCADLHVDMTIDKLIVHEDHNNLPRSMWDDIALIRFDRDVTFSEYIRPICLPLDDELRTGNTTGLRVTEVGWSRTVGSQFFSLKSMDAKFL